MSLSETTTSPEASASAGWIAAGRRRRQRRERQCRSKDREVAPGCKGNWCTRNRSRGWMWEGEQGSLPFQDSDSFRLPPLQCATPGENSTTLQSTTQPPLCSHLQFMNSAPSPAHPPRGKSLSAASPWLLSPCRFPVTLGVHKQLGSMTQTKGQLSLSTLGHFLSWVSAAALSRIHLKHLNLEQLSPTMERFPSH